MTVPPHERHVEKQRLVVRGYELASCGVLPPSTLLRYIEHVRWRSHDPSSRIAVGRFWGRGVVRAQELACLKSVTFGDELEISAWVHRVGRTSLSFAHEIVHLGTGCLVATSNATIVSIGSNGAPKPLKPGIEAYVVDDRPVPRLPAPERNVPTNAWETPIAIRPSDQDMQQHVNHARYADYVEDTRLIAAAAGAYGPGADGSIRSICLEYEDQARLGDALVAKTWRCADHVSRLAFSLQTPQGVMLRAQVEV